MIRVMTLSWCVEIYLVLYFFSFLFLWHGLLLVFFSSVFKVSVHYCVEVQSIQKPLSSVRLLGNVFHSKQEVELVLLATLNGFILGCGCFLRNVLQCTLINGYTYFFFFFF